MYYCNKLTILMLALSFMLSACGGGGGGTTETNTAPDTTTPDITTPDTDSGTLLSVIEFTDPELDQCVRSTAAANGITLASEMTSLDCSQKNIRLLNGLESLENLETLNLSGNRIADISKLAGSNTLKLLDLSSIVDLRNIDDLLTLNNLIDIDLSDTGNGDISCAKLEELAQTKGSITAPETCKRLISSVVFADSTLQACVSVKATETGVSFTRDIKILECDASGITRLDGIEAFQQLQSINISGNEVSDISALGSLLKLVYINLAQNPITDISALGELPALRSLDLSEIPNLTDLGDLLNLTSLQELSVIGSGSGELACTALDNLSNAFENLSLSRSPGCKQLVTDVVFTDRALEQCVLDKGITFTSELNNILCESLGITSLVGMEQFTEVVSLNFEDNLISDLSPVSNLLKLRGLVLDDNNISDFFALSQLAELRLVQARNNVNLSNVNAITYMGNLKFLRLSGAGTDAKISCADLDKLSIDILSREIGNPNSPPEFEPPESCNGTSTTGINTVIRSDMNNDGAEDILLQYDPANSADDFSWQLGLSDEAQFTLGTFLKFQANAQFVSSKAIAIADANNDDIDDVLIQVDRLDGRRFWQVAVSDGTALTTLPAGTGDTADFTVGINDDARAIAFTDINGDGFADIFIQAQGLNTIGNIEYYISFGGLGGFSTAVKTSFTFDQKLGRPEIIALEDVNGDGTADLVYERIIGTRHCFYVRTFQNGDFETPTGSRNCASIDLPHEMQVKAVGVADMTGNGRSELVISYVLQGTTEWSYYTLGEGDRGSEWTFRQFFSSAEGIIGKQNIIAIADLNSDGRADILSEVTLGFQKKWVAHLATDYGLAIVQTWLTGDNNSIGHNTMGLRDYDGDGDLDLLIDVPKGELKQRLLVNINDKTSFQSEPATIWYTRTVSASVIGVEEYGLTTSANDNSALVARVGSTITYTLNDLKEELAEVGLSLQIPQPGSVATVNPVVAVNGCRIAYDDFIEDAENESAKVSVGVLVCSQQFGDHVNVTVTYLYSECELKGNGGGLLECEAGFVKEKLTVDFGGDVGTEIVVKGPNADYCGGITNTGACAGLEADVISGSGQVSVGNNEVGAEAGVGFGLTAGADFDDGVFKGKLGGKFLAGFTISITVDFKQVFSFGKDAFLFVGEGAETVILAAGSGIIDAVNFTGDVATVVGEEAVYIASEGAKVAVVVFTVVGESIVDIVNGIEAGIVAGVDFVGGVINDIGNGIKDGLSSVFDSIF
ncbi:MAG: hypothetical protein ACI8O8_001226 [Oleiphilaceae bacterium]|jgi:hypothetical protein